jgi:hypothetical protein
MSFTRAGKTEVKADNEAVNAGQTRCINCSEATSQGGKAELR